MMQETFAQPVRILGVCGSPRRASTLYCLQEALHEAEKEANVQTTLLHLRGKDQVKPCIHCDYCLRHPMRCSQKDIMNDWYDLILQQDGFILATPVYIGTVSAQLKAFMDRLRAIWVRAGALNGRAGGAIAVGGDRSGGHEPALQAIAGFYMTFGVFPIGGVPGGNLGACVWTRDKSLKFNESEDEEGVRVVRALARKVVQTARWLQQARLAVGPVVPIADPLALNPTMAGDSE